MKSLPSRYTAHLIAASLALLALASVARAQITFTVNTFTTDELTITLNPSTLSGSGLMSGSFTLYGAVGENFGSTYLGGDSWINGDGEPPNVESAIISETAPGSIGTVNFVTGSSSVSYDGAYGPYITISGDGIFTDGSSIASPYQITISGSGLFDLSTITAFRLYHGPATGNLQSTASASAVPEPSTYAAIFGALTLIGAILVRRFRS